MVAYTPDLMDRSKIAAASPDVAFAAGPGELPALAGAADLVVADLSRPGVLEVLAELSVSARVIGYGSHVDRATLERAAAAGCEAMPRSQFFRSLGELLGP